METSTQHMRDNSWKEAMSCLQAKGAPDELNQAIMKYLVNMKHQKETTVINGETKETQSPTNKRKVSEVESDQEGESIHANKKICADNETSMEQNENLEDSRENKFIEPRKCQFNFLEISTNEDVLSKKNTNTKNDTVSSREIVCYQFGEPFPEDDSVALEACDEKPCDKFMDEENVLERLEHIDTSLDSYSQPKPVWLTKTIRTLEGYPELQQGLSSIVSDFPGSERGLLWLADLSQEDAIENVSKLLRNNQERTQKVEKFVSLPKEANISQRIHDLTVTEPVAHKEINNFEKNCSESENSIESVILAKKEATSMQSFQSAAPSETEKENSLLNCEQQGNVDKDLSVDVISTSTTKASSQIINSANDHTEDICKPVGTPAVESKKSDLIMEIIQQKKITDPKEFSNSEPKAICLNDLPGFEEIKQDVSSIIRELPKDTSVLEDSVSMELLQKLKKLQVINEKVSAALVKPMQPEAKHIINLYVVQSDGEQNQVLSESKVESSSAGRKSILRWVFSSVISYLITLAVHFGICVFWKEYTK